MIDAGPRRLRVFKCVVDLGGMTAAGNHLGISQPAVAAHVDALERQAGHPLLVRRRGVRPIMTQAGRVVYDYATDVLRRSSETDQRLRDLEADQAREVVMAVHRDLALSFLPERLARFSEAHRQIRVVTRIGTIDDVLALVARGSVRLGLTLSDGTLDGLTSEVVGQEPLEVVAAPSNPLAVLPRLGAMRLAASPFVTGLRYSSYFRLIDKALRTAGVGDYKVAMELQESAAVKQAVRHGNAIACLPRSTVQEEIAGGVLVALRLERPLDPLQIRCAHATRPDPAARRLIAFFRSDR